MRTARTIRLHDPPVVDPSTNVVPGLTFRLLHDNRIGLFGVHGGVSMLHLNLSVLRGSEAFLRYTCHVIVDFTKADPLHESRLGFLAYGQSFVQKRGRRFVLVAPHRERVFRNLPVDMDRVFTIHSTVEEAVRELLADGGA